MTVESLIEKYHQLSEAERLRFLELIHPVDESSNNLSKDWIEEITKRWTSFKNGEIEPIDGIDMENQLTNKYGIKL